MNFDGLRIGNCSIDANVNVKSITVAAGYTGTITQGAFSITTVNNASFSGGTFAGGLANITIGGYFTLSGTAFTSTSGILELDNTTVAFTSGSFLHNNGTVRLNNNGQTISGISPVFYNLEFVGAGGNYNITAAGNITVLNTLSLTGALSYNINTGTIDVKGDITSTNTFASGGGSAQININGTGIQNFTGNTTTAGLGAWPQVNINKASGSLNLINYPCVANSFTYTAGTVNPGTSTLCFTRGSVAAYAITGSLALNSIAFVLTNTVTATITGTLTANGDLTIAGTGNATLNTGNINVNGNIFLTNTSNAGGGTATINIIGTGNQTIDGTAVAINQGRLPIVNINKTSGTVSLLGIISFANNITYSAGTINAGTSTCCLVKALTISGNFSIYNLTVYPTVNTNFTIAAGSTLTVTNDLDLETSFRITLNTGVIAVQGNIIDNNTNTTGGGTTTILINGAGAQTITATGVTDQGSFPAVTINKGAGTLNFPSLITVTNNWTYVSGSIDMTSNNSTVVFDRNNLTINSAGMNFNHVTISSNTVTLANNLSVNGNLTISGTGILAAASNTINLSGNWTNRGTAGFTEATSTVNFNGPALQTVTSPGGENFANLTINNTGAGIQLINNTTIASTLTMTQGNVDLNNNALTLGLSGVNRGTLVRSAGIIFNTGTFTRWFNTSTVANGAIAGLFPVGTAANYRPLYVSMPSIGPTTSGTITTAYVDAATNSVTSIPDGPDMILVRKDLNWTLSTANGLAGGTYNLRIDGTGFGMIGDINDLRISLAAGVIGSAGTNAGTTTNPQINRTGLSLANLSNTFYIGSVNNSRTPLPVKLISFTATVQHDLVRLDWETSSELNNDHFTIQRSADAMNWEDRKIIRGSANTSENSFYTSYDENPLPGTSYYRLKQTDIDGKNSYSIVRVVTISKYHISVYPIPASNFINIESSSPQTKMDVEIYNSMGQAVNMPVINNGNKLRLDVSGVRNGIYFIKILLENYSETRMIIVQKHY